MGIFDSRIDDRPPTYAKGQWFHGVPHSRVIITLPGATGDAAFARGGIVIPLDLYDDTDPNNGFAEWFGNGVYNGILWSCRWRWSVGSASDGTCNFLGQLIGSTGGWEANATDQLFRPNLTRVFILPLGISTPSGQMGNLLVKCEVPEWSNVLDHWPNAVAMV